MLRRILNRILRRRPAPRPRSSPTPTLDRIASEAKAAGMTPSQHLERLLMGKSKT